MKFFLYFTILFFLATDLAYSKSQFKINYKKVNDIALKETLIPVHPGEPEKRPFWNMKAKRFMYAPAFDFSPVPNAIKYRFTAYSISDQQNYTFESDKSWNSLAPIWKRIPVGDVNLTLQCLDKEGKAIGNIQRRKFYRAAPFQGPYASPPRMDYKKSALFALEYLFNLEHYQSYAKTGLPGDYRLNKYPSKMVSAVINGMLLYAKLSPENSKQAMLIAKNAYEYLTGISEPAGTPTEFFPPTYINTGKSNKIMMNYPAWVGLSYLNLYDATKNIKYINAAKRIADTYKNLQLDSGTWYYMILRANGKGTGKTKLVPDSVLEFLARLEKQYKQSQYQATIKAALNWLLNNPIKDYNWQGQFEDKVARPPYHNLSHSSALRTARYLISHSKINNDSLNLAKELYRFSEDQFVVWESAEAKKHDNVSWHVPCVLEQYVYYVPIDGSATSLIDTSTEFFRVTGEKIYLAKAMAMANSMTWAQNPVVGVYPTFWRGSSFRKRYKNAWINTVTNDAIVMYKLGILLDGLTSSKP